MKRYLDIIYIIIMTACICGFLLMDVIDIFALHVAFAAVALLASGVHCALTYKSFECLPLEIGMRVVLLLAFCSGLPIASRVIPWLDTLHVILAYSSIVLFVALFAVKYLFRKKK